MTLDRHMSAELDNYITGHYGADQFSGTEDKCSRCLESADEETAVLGNIPEAEINDLCLDCAKSEIEENTELKWDEIKDALLTRSDEARLARMFGKGWDHFLKCIDFKHSFLDAEAIGWMNDIGCLSNKIEAAR